MEQVIELTHSLKQFIQKHFIQEWNTLLCVQRDNYFQTIYIGKAKIDKERQNCV